MRAIIQSHNSRLLKGEDDTNLEVSAIVYEVGKVIVRYLGSVQQKDWYMKRTL